MSLTPSLRREAEPYARRLERLPPPSKLTRSSLNVRNHPPPSNFLANALNQTFQLNSTTAHVPTTPLFIDAIPPVTNPVVSPTVKPQYRDFGVQKNLNFTRNTSTIESSENLSSCIIKLEAENRDLRAQAEKYKHDCEVSRESLDEINRLYDSGHHHLPPSGPSNFTSHPPMEFSVHPRWRTRNIVTDNQLQSTDLEKLDFPPIETLPLLTPSSPESDSASHRRRTPMAPRGLRMRGHGNAPGDQVQPYVGLQQHRRRRGPSDPTNGRRQRGGVQGPPSLDRGGRLVGSPAPPNSASATSEAGVSGTLPTIDADHDKGGSSP